LTASVTPTLVTGAVAGLAALSRFLTFIIQADRVETLFTGASASIGFEILSEFFEPGIFGL